MLLPLDCSPGQRPRYEENDTADPNLQKSPISASITMATWVSIPAKHLSLPTSSLYRSLSENSPILAFRRGMASISPVTSWKYSLNVILVHRIAELNLRCARASRACLQYTCVLSLEEMTADAALLSSRPPSGHPASLCSPVRLILFRKGSNFRVRATVHSLGQGSCIPYVRLHPDTSARSVYAGRRHNVTLDPCLLQIPLKSEAYRPCFIADLY